MVVQLPPDQDSSPHPTDVEAGVIKDARARHRRERWAGATIAALAIAAGLAFAFDGGGGGGSAASGRDHGRRPPRGGNQPSSQISGTVTHVRSVLDFGLLAPGVGWVATDRNFDLTHDGGFHWRTSSQSGSYPGAVHVAIGGKPPHRPLAEELGASSSPSARVLALSYLSHRRIPRACHEHGSQLVGVLALSADAGSTWATRPLPGCALPQSLSFVNAKVGYVVSTADTHDSSLYRTDDGGVRWHRVSRFSAPMTVSFGTRSDGLAFVTPNTVLAAAVLYRTTDGGRRWRRLSFCGDTRDPTFTVYCDAPLSFGAHGLVLAVAQDLTKAHSDHAFLYSTADAGAHWTRRSVPPLDSPEMPAFSAPNPRDIFLYSIDGVMHISTNGGRSWSSISEPQFRTVEQMQFVNAHYGWLLSAHGLDYTVDGGRSWRPVGSH